MTRRTSASSGLFSKWVIASSYRKTAYDSRRIIRGAVSMATRLTVGRQFREEKSHSLLVAASSDCTMTGPDDDLNLISAGPYYAVLLMQLFSRLEQ
jgi:hypothetical protein